MPLIPWLLIFTAARRWKSTYSPSLNSWLRAGVKLRRPELAVLAGCLESVKMLIATTK